MESVIKFFKIFSNHSSLWVIATAVVAFFVPDSFGWVRGNVSSVILGIIMLTMGVTLTVQDFKNLAARPLDIGIGALAQFIIMPVLAFTLSKVFGLNPYLAVGIILVGCCPGGVSSNLMSFLCMGDVAYSVGMTTVSTLLAPIMTPFLVYMLADTSIDVDAWGMLRNIFFVTILPLGLGFLLKMSITEGSKTEKSILESTPGLAVISLMMIVGGVVSQVQPQLIKGEVSVLFIVLGVVVLHNGLGYLLGYNVGRLLKFPLPKKKTLALEIGMQNAGMATVLASTFFVKEGIPETAICVLPCAISCAYHSISGTILAGWFKKQDSKCTTNS